MLISVRMINFLLILVLSIYCSFITSGQDHLNHSIPEHPNSTISFTPTPILVKSVKFSVKDSAGNDSCPVLQAPLDELTQDEFTVKLTDSCRYDRLIKPVTEYALKVHLQIDVRHIESVDNLQFKSHILVQLRYRDKRLRFEHLSPRRGNLMGQEILRNRIWIPHIVVKNERDSSLMGLDGKDVFVKIAPNGDVTYSYRMTSTFYCWMNLRKFPFDYQLCDIMWASWAYNTSNLDLNWVREQPFKVSNNLHLTEFTITSKWTEKTVIESPFEDQGGLAGDFSALVFNFRLRREVGYYVLGYFLPSIMLVVMSWVTFWIQADVAPARVALGTSTMLSFITLNGNVTKHLPRVSYGKASEIWFFGCATFIFLSLAEFAFVNVIWRRTRKVELIKHSPKHILKGAVSPSLARKDLRKSESFSSLEGKHGTHLTVHGSSSSLNVPTINTQTQGQEHMKGSATNISVDSSPPTPTSRPTWTSMTPHEIAIWIDRRSRIVFPLSFAIFNLFYWSFVYAL